MKLRVGEVKSVCGKHTYYQIQQQKFLFWWEPYTIENIYDEPISNTFESKIFAETAMKEWEKYV